MQKIISVFRGSHELINVLTQLKKYGCYTIVSTNGTIHIKDIKKYFGLIDWFDVSIPATNRELYHKIRGYDCFDIVVSFIKSLVNNGQRVRLSYTISKENVHDWKMLPQFTKNLGINNLRVGHTYQPKTGEPATQSRLCA